MKISKIDSLIYEIIPYVTLYNDHGFIRIKTKKNNNDYRHQQDIKNKIIQLGSSENLEIYPSTWDQLSFRQIDRFRDLIDILYRNNYLSISDRSNIEPEIREIELILENKSKISSDTSFAQKDSLCYITEPYMDEIVENMMEYSDSIPVLVYLTKQVSVNTLKNWYVSKHNISLSEAMLDSLDHLSKISRGAVELSSTYLKIGNNIPCLETQQNIIISLFEKKIKEKFPHEVNEYKRFYTELCLDRIKNNQSLSKRISNKYVIDNLTGFPEKDVHKTIEIKNGIILSRSFFARRNENQSVELSSFEEKLFEEFSLKRFPISEADFPIAINCAPFLITNLNEAVIAIDGDLTSEMTELERLYEAIETNDSNEINLIVTTFNINLNAIDVFNPLTIAVEKDAFDAIEELIKLGADVNQSLDDSPLSRAAYRNNLKLIKYLIERGANITELDKNERLPLHWLFATSKSTRNSDIDELSVSRMKEMIELLDGTSPQKLDDTLDNNGENCLLIASKNACPVGIIALLELGASPTVQNKNGLTAYEIISHRSHPLKDNEELLERLRPSSLALH